MLFFATEALGMGADFRDVRRTINWAIPTGEHPATHLQRGGRASRDKLDGEMIMLLPEWTSGERSSGPGRKKKEKRNQNSSNSGLEAGENQKAKKLTDEQRRSNLSDFYYNLANLKYLIRRSDIGLLRLSDIRITMLSMMSLRLS